MSKRMIDSEVSDRIKYNYDEMNDESHIDINADSVHVTGTMGANYIVSDSSIYTDGRMQCDTLSIKNSTTASIVDMYVSGSLEYLKGRQLANNQLYYHCIKLTSATKTAYVNIYSKHGIAVDNAQRWVNVIIGNKTSPNDIDWYYGTDGHVVHSVWKSLLNRVETTIDGEEVTAYEGHVNGLYKNKLEVVE